MAKKLYSFDDHPEHRDQMGPWAEKWIANGLNCAPMDDADRDATRVAIEGLYRATTFAPPEPHRIIFVSSPLVGAIASSVASAVWWIRENPAEVKKLFGRAIPDAELMKVGPRAAVIALDRCLRSLRGEKVPPLDAVYGAVRGAVDDAVHDAVYGAVDDAVTGAVRGAVHDAVRGAVTGAVYGAVDDAVTGAVRGAVHDAVRGAVHDAVRGAVTGAVDDAVHDAVDDAVHDAVRGAVHGAVDDAVHDAVYDAVHDAVRGAVHDAVRGAVHGAVDDAVHDAVYGVLVRCCTRWWTQQNGGNAWSGWAARISFFRHVANLDIDFSKWQHYEAAAIHSGWRFMHHRFCIVADRPEFVHRDARNRAHRADGPHIRWRDGVELHHIHGIRVTPRITAGQFTSAEILAERNVEVRRVMIERYDAGDPGRFLRDAGARVVHTDTDVHGRPRRLLQIDLPDDEPMLRIEMVNASAEPDGSRKTYLAPVAPDLRPDSSRGMRHRDPRPQPATCQNALAATYGFYGHEYRPALET